MTEKTVVLNKGETPPTKVNARLASLDVLLTTTIPLFLDPLPAKPTLRQWLHDAKVPRFKSNPIAKRGGGPTYYSVTHVEKFLKDRTTVGK
ncbi:MAG TPA: hypothetical protein VNT99_20335 [Methylomirabilota bacterium]|nr:hypothetical protein [Methylomirabilota bacterium]